MLHVLLPGGYFEVLSEDSLMPGSNSSGIMILPVCGVFEVSNSFIIILLLPLWS